jgi:hypothetical protein
MEVRHIRIFQCVAYDVQDLLYFNVYKLIGSWQPHALAGTLIFLCNICTYKLCKAAVALYSTRKENLS